MASLAQRLWLAWLVRPACDLWLRLSVLLPSAAAGLLSAGLLLPAGLLPVWRCDGDRPDPLTGSASRKRRPSGRRFRLDLFLLVQRRFRLWHVRGAAQDLVGRRRLWPAGLLPAVATHQHDAEAGGV